MKEKGIYTKEQVMNDADRMLQRIEVARLQEMEQKLIGGSDRLLNYDNMIVEPFESSTKEEVEKNTEEITKVFDQYPDLKDIAKLKLDILLNESDDEERVNILKDFKERLFPVLEKNI